MFTFSVATCTNHVLFRFLWTLVHFSEDHAKASVVYKYIFCVKCFIIIYDLRVLYLIFKKIIFTYLFIFLTILFSLENHVYSFFFCICISVYIFKGLILKGLAQLCLYVKTSKQTDNIIWLQSLGIYLFTNVIHAALLCWILHNGIGMVCITQPREAILYLILSTMQPSLLQRGFKNFVI